MKSGKPTEEEIDSVEALHAVFSFILLPIPKRPGAVIERLPEELRRRLRNLTSEGLAKFRRLGY